MTKEEYVALVHKCPCIVEYLTERRKVYGVHAHHLESVRHSLSDWAVVPLCPYHHQGAGGLHHLSRRGFELRYKLTEVMMLAATTKLVVNLLEKFNGGVGEALVWTPGR